MEGSLGLKFMIKMVKDNKEEIKRLLNEVADEDNWKPCIRCGGELVQERKAFFVCINCKQEYIADEQDMFA